MTETSVEPAPTYQECPFEACPFEGPQDLLTRHLADRHDQDPTPTPAAAEVEGPEAFDLEAWDPDLRAPIRKALAARLATDESWMREIAGGGVVVSYEALAVAVIEALSPRVAAYLVPDGADFAVVREDVLGDVMTEDGRLARGDFPADDGLVSGPDPDLGWPIPLVEIEGVEIEGPPPVGQEVDENAEVRLPDGTVIEVPVSQIMGNAAEEAQS